VTWQHPALRPHYRGWNGSTGEHDYNWWDAVHADLDGDGTNPCGFNTKAPCDDDTGNSHGSHTMGTAIGDDGAGNQIGVAPGAKWISCRNMDSGIGRPSTYIECLQFFLAPTDLQGRNPDPARRPDVVGNSYACPTNEQCTQDSLRVAVDNMRAGGIFMSVSAGNEGPNCSSVVWPPSHYDSSVSVGATDINDAIAGFSSRGPVTIDGSGRPKPDLVAPGVGVRSSTRTGYGALSGTSMASPHVGGAVALLWSALPNLRRDVDATERLLEQTAVQRTSTQVCGGNTATAVPNNVFGYGRIDVLAAYRAAAGPTPVAPAAAVQDAHVSEGKAGKRTPVAFTVTLAGTSSSPATVSYATVNGTATAGSDYDAATGTVTFAPGEQSKTVTVQVIGDATVEADETFVLRLSSPVNATLGRADATATITNDDIARDRKPPKLSSLRVLGRTLRFTLSEPGKATVSIKHGRSGVRKLTRSLKAGPASLRLPSLSPGRYVAAVTVRDAAGNVGRASRTFVVKRT
jgi:serine protease AprX